MNRTKFGVLAGLGFGVLDVLLMLPLEFPDKRRALLGAFLSRFAIGFLIAWIRAPLPLWLAGAIVGLLISLPDAVITGSYAPILGVGIAGGSLLGWATNRRTEREEPSRP
jgi:hypothetical protein